MEFQRFELLVRDKIKIFKNLKILVVGVGGVGGYAVESLVRCGIGSITLIDYDTVDVTNINRQVIALHSTIGQKKVNVLKERILDINPECLVKTYDLYLDSSNIDIILSDHYDYIFDCCDSLKSKEILIREAVRRNIKIISSMGAGYKFDPSQIKLAKLKNTDYDKIAKILRSNLKDNKDCMNIPVVYSTECVSIKEKTIASNSYIPSIFGLYMTSFLVNDVMGRVDERF